MAAILAAGTAFAGDTKKVMAPPVEEESDPVSGTLSLMFDSHFISYGTDVWAIGNDWDSVFFHPSLELTFDLGSGWGFILGTWWDVNDQIPDAEIGEYVQEVDVWGGFSYATGPFTFKLLYQEWMYASQSERIVDFTVAYDTFFSPYITLHGRVDSELAVDNGLVIVLGGSHSIELDPVTISFPVSVAFFPTDDFSGGDAGFGYASVGVSLGVPVPFLPGEWTASIYTTGYYANVDVFPGNPDEFFITGGAGLTCAF